MASELEAILQEDEVWRSRLSAAEAEARARREGEARQREADRQAAEAKAARDLEDELARIRADGDREVAARQAARAARLADHAAAAEAALDAAAERFVEIVLGVEGVEGRRAPGKETK